MVIEENENANYLAHYKTKGAKNGIRRFQSYLVQPNPSGATGQEVGEAAEQRQRITGHDERKDDQHQNEYRREEGGDRNAAMQRLQERVSPRKKTTTEILQDRKKKKWAKSYKTLYKHADSFSNKELNDAITRLDLKDRIKNKHLSSLARNTQDGSNALRNIAQGSASMLSIYNALALGVNAYNEYTGGKNKKSLPTINTSFVSLGGGGGNKDKNAKHDALIGPYLEHFGVPGQKWYHRFFQSYKTAPTRSGKVGEEHGLASAQAERVGEEEEPKELYSGKDALKSLGLDGYDRRDSEYSFGKFTSYDKNVDSDTDGHVRFSLDKEDIYKQESVDTMKRAEKEWTRIKATVIPDVKSDVVDMLEEYDNMSRSEAEKAADKMFKPSNLDFHVRPTLPGFVEISLYSNESPYGDHSFDFEYDVYNHKKEPGFAMNG